MRYLSGGLFYQNKFPVKFIDPNLFFPWLLVFYYLTDAFVLVLFHVIYIRSTSSMLLSLNHSRKKRKDSLDRVLLAAELEFPKILVPRLPQHTSNVNNECAGKSEWSKQLYSLYVTSFLEH